MFQFYRWTSLTLVGTAGAVTTAAINAYFTEEFFTLAVVLAVALILVVLVHRDEDRRYQARLAKDLDAALDHAYQAGRRDGVFSLTEKSKPAPTHDADDWDVFVARALLQLEKDPTTPIDLISARKVLGQ